MASRITGRSYGITDEGDEAEVEIEFDSRDEPKRVFVDGKQKAYHIAAEMFGGNIAFGDIVADALVSV